MGSAIWFALVGILFIVMTIISAALKRLPLTAALLYLLIGVLLGRAASGVLSVDPVADAPLIRLLAEIAVLISLFTAGLKLRLPLSSAHWKTPILLATLSMLVTIALVAVFAFWAMKLPLGAAILLGAILAPTDPVLASSVQVLGPEDQDKLRFSLTAEAGLNDGTAFPFVLLGLGLLNLRGLNYSGVRWVAIDLIWGVFGGLLIGTLVASAIGKLVAYLRFKHQETESFDDFLAIGLIGLSYGLSAMLNAYGFLAVFAAGVALRRIERKESHVRQAANPATRHRIKDNTVSAHMTRSVLRFNEQVERIGEVGVVILSGAMLSVRYYSATYLWLIPVLFVFARPISVFLVIPKAERAHRALISWFGIRGIGPIYYLAYAIERGLPVKLAEPITGATLTIIVASIFLHGLSAAPLMMRYARRNP